MTVNKIGISDFLKITNYYNLDVIIKVGYRLTKYARERCQNSTDDSLKIC